MVVTKIKLPAVLTKDPDDECPFINLDTSGNLKVVVAGSEILQAIQTLSHWAESRALVPSAVYTASDSTDDIDVSDFIKGIICLDVTAVSGTFLAGEGLRVYIEGKDDVTGNYKTIYDSYSAIGDYIQDTTTTPNWSEIFDIPYEKIRVRWEITGTTPSFTFAVGLVGKA